MTVAVVVAAVVLLAVAVAVMARQGSVGRLSHEAGRNEPGDHVVERPAGPDAEAMTDDTFRRRPRPGD